MTNDWGIKTEKAALHLAGELGLPDFVYDPVVVDRREISDGVLLTAGEGLIVQSKARAPDASDDPQKASAWITKQISAAERQVRGSRRWLRLKEPVEFVSRRGHVREVRAAELELGVILISHPALPENLVPDWRDDILVMTFEDWNALHWCIRSTSGVIRYVRRALQSGLLVPLGDEHLRYRSLAAADARGSSRGDSVPDLLPGPPTNEEEALLAVVEEWVERDLVHASGTRSWSHPDEYRHMVEQIDQLPVGARAELGYQLLRMARLATRSGLRHSTTYVIAGAVQFVLFAAGPEWWSDGDALEDWLAALAADRHGAMGSQLESTGPTLLLARSESQDGSLSRSYVFIDGEPPPMPTELRWQILSHHGVWTPEGPRAATATPRNSRCPCQSGRKFKHCHLRA